MSNLLVTLKIPIDSNDSEEAITFSHWLPIGRQEGISVVDGDITVLLWFDERCVRSAFNPTAEELKRYVNLDVRFVYADVQIVGVAEELLVYMQRRDYSKLPDDGDEDIESEYAKLGKRILTLVVNRVNRLIAFARSNKGQYWLSERKQSFDHLRSDFIEFEARGVVNGGATFTFRPSVADTMVITSESEDRYVTESDWPTFRDFVAGTGRTSLIGDLLVGAEYLLSIGHYRSAITEGVTALEIAVFNFSRDADADKAFAIHLAERLALTSLKSQVEHLGLSASVGYLLPTILGDKIMPTPIISGCQVAILKRQNIVHNGSRNVSKTDAKNALSNIRIFCRILETLTTVPV